MTKVSSRELTWDEAINILTELEAAVSRDDVQDDLRRAWTTAGDDRKAQETARSDILLPVRTHVIEKYGFEASRKGAMECTMLYEVWNHIPEIHALNGRVHFRSSPGEQLEYPTVEDFLQRGWPANPPAAKANAKTKPFTLQNAKDMQEELIKGYESVEFNEALQEVVVSAAGDSKKLRMGISDISLKIVQSKVFPKYAFETSKKGVMQSVAAFSQYNMEHAIARNNAIMQYHTNPELQEVPLLEYLQKWEQMLSQIEASAAPEARDTHDDGMQGRTAGEPSKMKLRTAATPMEERLPRGLKGHEALLATAELLLEYEQISECIEHCKRAEQASNGGPGKADALRLIVAAHISDEKHKDGFDLAASEYVLFEKEGDQRGMASMMIAMCEAARTKMGSKKRARGLQLCLQAVEICRSLQDTKLLGHGLLSLGNVQLQVAVKEKAYVGIAKAIKSLRESSQIFHKVGNKLGEGKAWQGLGWSYFYDKDWQGSEKAFLEAKRAFTELGSEKYVAQILSNMSQMLMFSEETDASLQYSLEAQKIFDKVNFPDNRGYDISTLGMVIQAYLEKGEIEMATKYAEDGLVDFKDAKDQHARAASLDLMSQVLQAKAEKERAHEYQQEAVKIVEDLGTTNRRMDDTRFQSKMYQQQAHFYAEEGDIMTAQKWAQKSLDLARQTNDSREETDAILSISNAFAVGQCWGDAMLGLKEAASRYAEAGNKAGEATALLNLAQYRHIRGLHKKAEAAAAKALTLFQDDGNKRSETETMVLLAQIQMATGDYDSARRTGARAQSLLQDLKERPDSRWQESKILTLIAEAAFRAAMQAGRPENGEKPKPEWENAYRNAVEARKFAELLDDNTFSLAPMNIVASCEIAIGQPKKAATVIEEALKICENTREYSQQGKFLLLDAVVHYNLGRAVSAKASAGKAQKIFRRIGDSAGEREATEFLDVTLGEKKKRESKQAAKAQRKIEKMLQGGSQRSSKGKRDRSVSDRTERKRKGKMKVVKQSNTNGLGEAVTVYKGPPLEDVQSSVKASAVDLIGTESLEDDVPLMDAGLDSLAAVEFQSLLSKQFRGVNMPATLMFDMPNIKQISEFVFEGLKETMTVTEMVGEGQEPSEADEDEDTDDSSSSEEREHRRRKEKVKAAKPPKSTGLGEAVTVYKGPPFEDVQSSVKSCAIDLIGTESLEEDTPLMDAGLDSLAAVEFQSLLSKQFRGVNMPATLMFDMPNTKQISEFVFEGLKETMTVTEMVGGGEAEDDDEEEDDEQEEGSSDVSDDDSDADEDDDDNVALEDSQAIKKHVPVYTGPSSEDVLAEVKAHAMELIGSNELEMDTALMDAGLDSLAAVEYQSMLGKEFVGVHLPATLIFDMPTIKQISELIYSEMSTNSRYFK